MGKMSILVGLVLMAGCQDSSDEITSLRLQVARLEGENAKLRVNLPSETPAIVKQLEEANGTISELTKQLNDAKLALSKGIAPEILPLSRLLIDMRSRLEVLERTASRKGHTHEYSDGEGTLFSRTTEGDK